MNFFMLPCKAAILNKQGFHKTWTNFLGKSKLMSQLFINSFTVTEYGSVTKFAFKMHSFEYRQLEYNGY